MTEKEALEKQLKDWVAGESNHDHINDQCCPDFSCAHPELLADEDTRVLYASAWVQDDEETLSDLNVQFLVRMMAFQMGADPDEVVIQKISLGGENKAQWN